MNQPYEDSIDLLDVLLTLAENLKLLVFGALAAGLLAYGVAQVWPKKFESTAVVRADAAVATQMTTAPVVDAALNKLGYLKGLNEEEAEEARETLQRNISTQVGRNDRLVTLNLTARTPEQAQQLANEILANVFVASQPGEAERKRLEAEKQVMEQQVKELTETARTARRLLEEATPNTNAGTLASSIAAISANLVKIQENISALDKKLMGLNNDDVLQAPTLPKKHASPKAGLVAIMATIGAGILLVIFVVARQALRVGGASDQHRERMDRLKRQYGLGRQS